MKKTNIIKRICFTAAFSAITAVLYCFLKFKLPFFPSWLDVNFSMIPVIICAFMLGPVDASICVILRCLMKWWWLGSSTGYVGELADILMGLAACIPAGIIYNYTKFKGKTIVSLASVAVGWIGMGIVSNIFINIPWYTNLYFKQDYYATGVPAPLIGMASDAFKMISFGAVQDVNADNFMPLYIFLAVIPFNLMLSAVVIGITAPIHKRLRILYDMIGKPRKAKEEAITNTDENDEAIDETKSVIDINAKAEITK